MEDWIKRLLGVVSVQGKDLISNIVGTFSDDGILSMKNITDFGVAIALGKLFPGNQDKAGDQLASLEKEFSDFLPKYVDAKIAAGRMENIAQDDLRNLLDYGIVTERNEQGQIKNQTQSEYAGRVGTELRQKYGVLPEYDTVDNADGSKSLILNDAGQPIIKKSGRPGYAEMEQDFIRNQKRLSSHYETGTRVENVDRAGVPLAQGINRMQDVLQEEVRPTQAQAGDSFRSLLAAQDPNRLSGSEMANVERGLGRMGMGLGRAAEMDKYKAAAVFGDALAQKQQRLGQALGQTGNVMASLRSGGGINPGVAYGEGTMPTPTSMAGQLPTFGNTSGNALGAVQPIIANTPAPQTTSDLGRKIVLGDLGQN